MPLKVTKYKLRGDGYLEVVKHGGSISESEKTKTIVVPFSYKFDNIL
jgi:hypothetical protein